MDMGQEKNAWMEECMPHPWRGKTYGVCEHGYDVYDEWSGEPGFRDSEMETDCPICKKKDLKSIEIFPKDGIR